MRIISGALRGRRIEAVPGHATRPTPDRVREALFSILQGRITPCTCVLDCFAGSGALGFEAISRGAAYARFFEADARAYSQLKRNAANLGLSHQADIRMGDFTALPAGTDDAAFGLVFMDPPYGANLYAPAFAALQRYVLAPGAIVVAEHERTAPTEQRYGAFVCYDSRLYGRTGLSFYRKQD